LVQAVRTQNIWASVSFMKVSAGKATLLFAMGVSYSSVCTSESIPPSFPHSLKCSNSVSHLPKGCWHFAITLLL
jgi:hypothetical protein